MSFFFSSSYLLSGHSNGTIGVWDLDFLELFSNLKEHTSNVTCLTVINNQSFASGSADKTIKIWDSNFKVIITLNHHLASINALVSLDSTYLISASKDNFLRVYKTRDIQNVNEFNAHLEAIYDIEILDDKNECLQIYSSVYICKRGKIFGGWLSDSLSEEVCCNFRY